MARPGSPAEPPLAQVTLGLETPDGYSGDDLTSARAAIRDGELDQVTAGLGAGRPVLELRVHGVGGATPPVNLETPQVIQVSGDGLAGFYRSWYPGGKPPGGRVPRESYCWGKLDYAGATSALWLLLMPFALVNVAHWALPGPGQQSWLHAWSRALLRLLGLVFTVAFTGTAAFLVVDILAWQAAPRGALWSWLDWLAAWPTGARLAVALYAVLLVIGGLFLLSWKTTRAYEAWAAGTGAPDEPGLELSKPGFWCGQLTLVRQRGCHVMAASAVVITVAALPGSGWPGFRLAAFVVAGLLAAAATGLTLSPWTDRTTHRGGAPGQAVQALAAAGVAAAVAISTAQFWWPGYRAGRTIPGDGALQVVITAVEFGVVVLLALLVAAQRPWRNREAMGHGMTAVMLALLAAVISVIFGSALILTVTNLLGSLTPRPTVTGHHPNVLLYVPASVYAGGAGFLIAVIMAALIAVALTLVWRRLASDLASSDQPDRRFGTGTGTVRERYRQARPAAGSCDQAVSSVARSWATAALTDYAAPVLTAIALPVAAGTAADEVLLLLGPGPGWIRSAAAVGGTLAVLAIGWFLNQLRRSLTSAAARKKFSFIWDVITFWPRACHPFAPPCYAERSVPELVIRIRRLTGDRVRNLDRDPAFLEQQADVPGGLTEPHARVLLSGYSQGAPISVAAMAQLPVDVRPEVALLTLAAPVRRLYGRAFPAYFGTGQLEVLRAGLTEDGRTRWRNVVRRSDYIGGYVFDPDTKPTAPSEPAGAVDRGILDPPGLWRDDAPNRPPTHMHSGWFPDPQTRPSAEELIGLLR